MPNTDKRRGLELGIRSFKGDDGYTYIVFKTPKGSYHAFKELEAKAAAKACGAKCEGVDKPNTRQLWGELWNQVRDA